MRLKLGAYVRVSTEEQASAVEGSLENQKYRLKAYVDLKNTQVRNWGEIVEFYIDDGFSAKDTRRPAYQRMMTDIKRKRIDLILVTDLSRLSRNIYDFCNLMDELEKNEAQFLSIKEQFDSTTPAGKMMIYNMINLAQFEREQISERVALGAHSRAMRGLLNGAKSILGFDKNPDKPGSYMVNEDEAGSVRKIFRHFLNTGSCSKTIQELQKEGIKPKMTGMHGNRRASEHWTRQKLTYLLSSAAYIGFHEVNKRNKNCDQSKLKPHQQYKLVKATWPAIISRNDFETAQSLLEEGKRLERVRLEGAEDRFYVLSGILRCSQCGSPLVGQAAHGEKQVHRYYGHTNAFRNTACEYHRLPAQEVESAVLEYIWAATQDGGYLERIEKNLWEMRNVKSLNVARERRSTKEQLQTVQSKIDGLLLMQGQATSAEAIKFAMKAFEALSKEKAELEDRLNRLNSNADEEDVIRESINIIQENLRGFGRGYAKAKGSMKKRLLKKLLKQVVLTPEGLHIFMQLADGVEIPNHKIKLIRFEGSEGQKKSPFAITQKASGDDSNLLVLRSDNDRNGDATRI
ncbi:MAG: recombinase family protein [Bdellovibrionaceae bacterium]|nr:recombinase family protein [Pseudobdellovibrionaceae bacterium]